jgi:N utilization substance protein A
MSKELLEALKELERDRGIPFPALMEALRSALNTAYKKNFGTAQIIEVEIDGVSGKFSVWARKEIVDVVNDETMEISLADAQTIDAEAALGDTVDIEVTPSEFGRIAAQTAKQVVVQKLREAERNIIFEEFSEMEGEIINGVVQRVENKIVIVNLGKIEGIMTSPDLIPGEHYSVGQRIKAYIYEVKNTSKGPSIFLSRSHLYFLKRLFELEVHEIYDGTVEIVSVAREAGSRSKISVRSRDDNVDPVGACVGPRGIRVQNIVSELNGEKIDIIKYDKDPTVFIANALSPAKVTAVTVDNRDKIARVVVPDQYLSLAIGKEGQNVRLAAHLTGWKVDIRSESQAQEAAGEYFRTEEAWEESDELLEIDPAGDEEIFGPGVLADEAFDNELKAGEADEL